MREESVPKKKSAEEIELQFPIFFSVYKDGEHIDHSAFKAISDSTVGKPHLLFVGEAFLQESYRTGLAVVGRNSDDDIESFCRLITLNDKEGNKTGWYELGTVLAVHEKRHYVTRMLRDVLARFADKDILMTTTNKTMKDIAIRLGFEVVKREELPEIVWNSSCTCDIDKTGPCGPVGCKYAPRFHNSTEGPTESCEFYATPQTAQRHKLGRFAEKI